MNHVNGFDTTEADLKLVELFAARQLSSQLLSTTPLAHHDSQLVYQRKDNRAEPRPRAEHTRSNCSVLRSLGCAALTTHCTWRRAALLLCVVTESV